jgi:hypothetical protein
MAHSSDYHRGDMDIAEQVSTFHAFIGLMKWGALAIAVAVLFLAMIFCARTGLFQALLAAVVVTAAGIFMLREKPGASH